MMFFILFTLFMAMGNASPLISVGGVLPNQTQVFARGIDPSFLNSYQFRKIHPFLNIAETECPGALAWDHDVRPNVVPSFETVTFRTCYDRPVTVDQWTVTLVDNCEASGHSLISYYQQPLGHKTRLVQGTTTDVIDHVELQVCVKPFAAECWGEWINKPVWDYEWIIKIPLDGVYDKEVCGAAFLNALNEACAPFEMTKFTCEPQIPGAIIRFRHKLLCGRTRIQAAILKASNGQLGLRCPYFVEVPVPP